MKWTIPPLLALLLLVPGIQALATGEDKIRLQSVAEIEVQRLDENGKPIIERVIAEKIMPGSEVIYTNRFTNEGDQPARDLVLTNPVPDAMTYLEDSAKGAEADVTFSIDGGNRFDTPGALLVLGEDGKMRTAKPEEYTHIRWQIPIELRPGDSGEVSFRARLN